MQVVPNLKGKTIGRFAQSNINEHSTIQTDTYHSYRKPLSEKYIHEYDVFSPDSGMLNWLYIMIGNAKAFVIGTFHGLDEKHLQNYWDEFSYRFNRRYLTDIFENLCFAVISAKPLSYAKLNY